MGWLYINTGVWAGTSFKSNGFQKRTWFRTRGYDYDPLVSIASLRPDFLGWGNRDRDAEQSWKRITWWSSPRYFEVDDVRFQEGEFTVSIIHWCSLPGSFPLKLWISETYEFIMYIDIVWQYPCPTLGVFFSIPKKHHEQVSQSRPYMVHSKRERPISLVMIPTFPTWYPTHEHGCNLG